MKARTLGTLLATLTALVLLCPRPAAAVPVFARKYGTNCTMCHSSVPRLNDFGQRYRANGYRMPDREEEERTVLDSPPPFAARTGVGFLYDDLDRRAEASGGSDASTFQLTGLDLFSAGLLGRHVGYLAVYVPPIPDGPGLAAQEGTLEMASLVFSGFAGPWLNVRVGRFEPAYVTTSAKRVLSGAPYEIYDAVATYDGGHATRPAFSDNQTGIEVTGGAREHLRYAAGWVTGLNGPDEFPADVYGRLAWVFGAGEGQTAGQRLGLVAYRGDTYGMALTRYGVDASLNVSVVNLSLQYVLAQDAEGLWNADEAASWWGGFAEASVAPWVRLVGFARFDLVDGPEDLGEDVQRYTLGARWYLEDNVAFHLEGSMRQATPDTGGNPPAATATSVAARADFVF